MSHQSDLISTDIDAYLAQHEHKELLRLLTCGSVDDGKSTLIGRLLHDSKLIYEDQLAAVKADSVKSGTTGGKIDLALLVDGLQAEREQGITIDVAYRYFSTSKRKFIIADTPGHEQYTRNMATGASTCDLAIILIDARYGVLTQTRRHSYIAALLGIKHVIVAINKMDLVDFDEGIYAKIKSDYSEFCEKLDLHDIRYIPLSALNGDNVVTLSDKTPWYSGLPLMDILESIEIASDRNLTDMRFPVQYVNRPNLDFRGYCGTVASGIVRKGDQITVLPSGKTSRIKSIVTYNGELEEAFPPQSVTLTLADEIDVSRGDILCRVDNLPVVTDQCDATVVWMTETPMRPGKEYFIKLGARTITGSISQIRHRTDVNSLEHHAADQLNLNEIGLCEVTLNAPIAIDPYKISKGTGSFIIIDRLTNVTVGAGMIIAKSTAQGDIRHVTPQDRSARYGQKAITVWVTGEGNVDTAYQLERNLFNSGHASSVLTGLASLDEYKNAAQIIVTAGLICICAYDQSPYTEDETNLIFSSTTDILASLKERQILN